MRMSTVDANNSDDSDKNPNDLEWHKEHKKTQNAAERGQLGS